MSDGGSAVLASLAIALMLALILVLIWAYSKKTKETFDKLTEIGDALCRNSDARVGFGAGKRARALAECEAWPGGAPRATAGSFRRRGEACPLEEGSWMASEDDVVPAPAFLRPDQTPTRFVDAGEDRLGPEGPTLRGRRPFSISVPDHSPLEN